MNTGQKGDYSELAVLTELVGQERRVAIPYGNSQGFDLLVLSANGKWNAVQVKTAYRRGARGDRIYVDTIRGGGLQKKRGYENGSFDFMIAVLPKEGKFWVISFEEMAGKRCITLPETRPSHWEFFD